MTTGDDEVYELVPAADEDENGVGTQPYSIMKPWRVQEWMAFLTPAQWMLVLDALADSADEEIVATRERIKGQLPDRPGTSDTGPVGPTL